MSDKFDFLALWPEKKKTEKGAFECPLFCMRKELKRLSLYFLFSSFVDGGFHLLGDIFHALLNLAHGLLSLAFLA